MLYGLLRSTRAPAPPEEPGYTPDLWRELDDLYRGGYQIQARAAHYLPASVGERDNRHAERLRLAAYISYFGQIVNAYRSALFAGPVNVAPAADADDDSTPGEMPDADIYNAFARDADLRGTPFSQVLSSLVEHAMVKRKALLAIDFPAAPGVDGAASRADTDRLGLARPYVYEIQPEEMTEWECDSVARRRVEVGDGAVEFEVSHFAWVILRQTQGRRLSPDQPRGSSAEEYKVWKRRPEDGVVVWELYRVEMDDEGKPPKDEADVQPIDGGATAFREIPIVEIAFPETLWLGNIIGPLNKEHWQRRSSLLAAQQRSLIVVPTIYLGPGVPEVGGAFNEAAEDPHRGDDPARKYERQGYLALADKDRLAFEGPPTDAFEIINTELKELVDEIHRISGRMAASISSTANAVGRSGASKGMDNRDFDTVCTALGAIIRDAARRIYDVIAGARGDEVCWTVHGLDRFDSGEDRAEVLSEALQLGAISIPSVTFKVEMQARTAFRLLPGLSPETQATIRAEIAAGTHAEGEAPPPLQPPPEDDNEDDPAEPVGDEAAPPPPPTKP